MAQDEQITDSAQWAMDLMQVPAAQATTTGEGVTVAVIDTGMGEHPFFDDKDVQPGVSYFEDEEDAWEVFSPTGKHGMQVAAGVLHVAPAATILPIRFDNGAQVLGGLGGLAISTSESFRYAADNGADVIVFAWGQGEDEEEITEAIQYAIDKGAVVVIAAGNDPESPPSYPANLPGVVAVTGTDESGNAWYGNSVGSETVIAAPAEDIIHPLPMAEDKGWGTEPEVEYEEGIAGTSVGSGFVGGVAALTLAANPDLDSNNVIQRLIQTAGDGSGTRTDDMGFGLVNADQAVNADGIETVDENPLGYPMGEAGASGAEPDGEEGADDEESGNSAEEPAAADGTEAASEESDSGLSTMIVIAAAAVLVAAAIAVWLVLRGRSRKQSEPAMAHASAAGAEGVPPASPPQPGPTQQFRPPPSGPPQGYGGPPPGPPQQNFSPPPPSGGGEPSPPWGPSDPNQRR